MLGSLACSESNFQIEFGYRWMTIELITKGPLLKACIVGNPETEVSHTTSESIVNRRAAAGAADKPTKNPLKPLRNLVLESVEEKRGCF